MGTLVCEYLQVHTRVTDESSVAPVWVPSGTHEWSLMRAVWPQCEYLQVHTRVTDESSVAPV